MTNTGLNECTPQVTGFVTGYLHNEELEFVPMGDGSDPTHGYFRRPEKPVQEMHVKNLIVNYASIFMAKRMRPGTSWGNGVTHLEVGTGFGTGTPTAPQTEVASQTRLRSPLARKAITSWTYLDANGNATSSETNIIQLTTTFGLDEANGALCEMGFFGGDATSTIGTGYMFNYKVFGAWTKTLNTQLTIVWKLTF